MAERSVNPQAPSRRLALWIGLSAVLLVCLWIGWSDFDPWLSKEDIRLSIRAIIRGNIQWLVQYVIPGAIAIYLLGEGLRRR
ncbi:MAG TPA: hypothetical protein PKZ76_08665 [Xanthomonadaceae bacterium]|nr:hypothetical protein [Xanthomonadaceae bacterium]